MSRRVYRINGVLVKPQPTTSPILGEQFTIKQCFNIEYQFLLLFKQITHLHFELTKSEEIKINYSKVNNQRNYV